VVLLVLAATCFALAAAQAQRTIGVSAFEWGEVKEFSGILRNTPYPRLLVARPGMTGTNSVYSSYLLVKPYKFGFPPDVARRFNGYPVTLRGTLIYRNGQTMLETHEDWIKPASQRPAETPTELNSLGRQTLRGEIVDSKCYLGVMNPGEYIPHRACAIRCISGGIPPVFVVRRSNGPPLHYLLVSAEGLSLNKEVLGFVAEPMEITGEVQGQGELLILRADPADFRRI
jgi:hypothetical protein